MWWKLQHHLGNGPFSPTVNTRVVLVEERWCVWHVGFVAEEGGGVRD